MTGGGERRLTRYGRPMTAGERRAFDKGRQGGRKSHEAWEARMREIAREEAGGLSRAEVELIARAVVGEMLAPEED